MKKYEYVSVHIGRFVGAKSKEHKQIIDDYAKKGYRYVGYIPDILGLKYLKGCSCMKRRV